MSEYITDVYLPTKGRIYPEESKIPEKVRLRSMTTKEEKIIYGSTDNAIEEVLQACIIEPEGLKVGELIAADSMVMLIDLRMVSYGTDYRVGFQCSECGKKNAEFVYDLTELEKYDLSEDFQEPLEIKLPRSGDTLGVFFLRNKDFKEIDKWEKRIKKQSPEIAGNVGYILRMASQIKVINGDEVSQMEAKKYVEEMQGLDSAYFWNQINKVKVGYDLTLNKECSFCGADNDFELPVTAEFFRPVFE